MGQTPAARPCQLRQKAAALGPVPHHTPWVTVPSSLSAGCLSPSMAAPQAGGSQPLAHPQCDTPSQEKGQAAVVCLRTVLHKWERFPKQPHAHSIVQPAMVQLLNWTPWGQNHITGMSLSVLQLTLFSLTTTSTTSIPLTQFHIHTHTY